ncbi:unnamed protein product [Acanthoscelides obtectus]|uniref:EMI domain-containing protein n=1 Tax=Acanthoscelides obtectus TaxID=200917 RepID=A0A9P0PM47_ACAOB|nr:unnamed protein product [Acanthoscelides obtectus]CAK1687773.1 Protein draper [Acanthoscelides obtectus]
MNTPAMWRVISLIVIFQSHIVISKLTGDNICRTEESYPANVTEYRLRNATFRNYKWCMNVPPRCSYYTVKTINESRVVEKILTRTVEECCEGFTKKEEICISNCDENCKNGKCHNGACLCFPGFKGQSCDVGCDLGTWGPNCSNNCDCEDKRCNPVNGTCSVELTVTSSPKSSTSKDVSITKSENILTSNDVSNKNGEIIQTSLSSTASTPNFVSTHKSQITLSSSPKRSTPTPISINEITLTSLSFSSTPSYISTESESMITTKGLSTSTKGTSLENDAFTNATDTNNNVVVVKTTSAPETTPKAAEMLSSQSNTRTTHLITPSTTVSRDTAHEFLITKGIQHVMENTSPSQTKQSTVPPSRTSNVSALSSRFHSTLEPITPPKPTQKYTELSQGVPQKLDITKTGLIKDDVMAKVTIPMPKRVSVQTEPRLTGTSTVVVASSSTKATILPTSQLTAYLNRSALITNSNEIAIHSTTALVNNVTKIETSESFSKSSTKPYSNEITNPLYKTRGLPKHSITTPLTVPIPKTGSTIDLSMSTRTPKHAEDQLDKPAEVNTTKDTNLDTILKEYTVPVEVKYEIPAQKKEIASTHENYAEEKNYLTLEDRGYINKHVSSDTEYFVNTFTAAAVVVLVVAVLLMMFLGWNNWRGKKAMEGRDSSRKGADAHSTSIFHTPLPDPPIIENPTYLLTTIDCKRCNTETLLLKAHQSYPIHRMSQMGEVREYMYDHPPSTGSYRAASTVDAGDVSCSYIGTEITEPVYDEIPLRNGTGNVNGANSEANMCLYVNTVGRTKF